MDKGVAGHKAGSAGAEQTHRYEPAMGYLRGFVVFLVVVHHSILGYMPGVPAPTPFAGGPMLWRAFPVLDSARWAPTGFIAGFGDAFVMALMFLLSGLFVTGSLKRKGVRRFLRDRLLRLGVGFLFAALIVVPIAYYTAYLQAGGTPGLVNYWHAWNAIGYWPTGPAWFVLLLLVYDAVVAALFTIVPNWTTWVSRLAGGARERPGRFYWIVVALSLLAYVPLAITFGRETWTYLGLLQFQTSRVLNYFLYFVLGIGIGAVGLESGLVASDGALARRWWLWVLAMIGSFLLGTALFMAILGAPESSRQVLRYVGTVAFVLGSAWSTFAFLAIFSRFARQPQRTWRSLADNSYGIYLVHYAFVAWCQYVLLSTDLPAGAKAASVIVVALALSWSTIALARRVPIIARVV
jgi:peptidoglycan/LPS O-acetylase OafA/YrhL